MPTRLDIDPDIRTAQTLPAAVYHDADWYERMRQRLFPRTWHLYPALGPERTPGTQQPWNFLAGCLDEPLLLTHDDDGLHLVSNVCTHRGAVLVERAGSGKGLRCPYHGRRFDLDGRFVSAPGFEDARDFPRPCDHLATVPLAQWEGMVFASLDPAHALAELLAPVRERLAHLPWDHLEPAPARSRDYHVSASWALYCDNYLEGLHVPYVHPGLNRVLDRQTYRTELLPLGVLQLGLTQDEGSCFAPAPEGHPDHGQRVAAYYYWLFPCTMVNVYPWGVSINVVIPLGAERCRVVFLSHVWDAERLDEGAGAELDQVEHEDERIVESVARGVRSQSYPRGRYAPDHEQGVHHFHRLLARFLDDA